jgi:hypothetical protein
MLVQSATNEGSERLAGPCGLIAQARVLAIGEYDLGSMHSDVMLHHPIDEPGHRLRIRPCEPFVPSPLNSGTPVSGASSRLVARAQLDFPARDE